MPDGHASPNKTKKEYAKMANEGKNEDRRSILVCSGKEKDIRLKCTIRPARGWAIQIDHEINERCPSNLSLEDKLLRILIQVNRECCDVIMALQAGDDTPAKAFVGKMGRYLDKTYKPITEANTGNDSAAKNESEKKAAK